MLLQEGKMTKPFKGKATKLCCISIRSYWNIVEKMPEYIETVPEFFHNAFISNDIQSPLLFLD